MSKYFWNRIIERESKIQDFIVGFLTGGILISLTAWISNNLSDARLDRLMSGTPSSTSSWLTNEIWTIFLGFIFAVVMVLFFMLGDFKSKPRPYLLIGLLSAALLFATLLVIAI